MDASGLIMTRKREGCTVGIRVKPGAKQDVVIGVHDGRLRMTVVAPPERGKANKAVARVIAGLLNLATSRVKVIAGFDSRDKVLLVEGCTPDELRRRLESMPRISAGAQRPQGTEQTSGSSEPRPGPNPPEHSGVRARIR
jgi:hypothetical protein